MAWGVLSRVAKNGMGCIVQGCFVYIPYTCITCIWIYRLEMMILGKGIYL